MLPALLFFIPMVAFYPEVQSAVLPSDFLLQRIGLPVFHLLFQAMIFSALLESGNKLRPCDQRTDRSCVGSADRQGPEPRATPFDRAVRHRRLHVPREPVRPRCFDRDRISSACLHPSATFILPLVTVGIWKLSRTRGPDPVNLTPSIHEQVQHETRLFWKLRMLGQAVGNLVPGRFEIHEDVHGWTDARIVQQRTHCDVHVFTAPHDRIDQGLPQFRQCTS